MTYTGLLQLPVRLIVVVSTHQCFFLIPMSVHLEWWCWHKSRVTSLGELCLNPHVHELLAPKVERLVSAHPSELTRSTTVLQGRSQSRCSLRQRVQRTRKSKWKHHNNRIRCQVILGWCTHIYFVLWHHQDVVRVQSFHHMRSCIYYIKWTYIFLVLKDIIMSTLDDDQT